MEGAFRALDTYQAKIWKNRKYNFYRSAPFFHPLTLPIKLLRGPDTPCKLTSKRAARAASCAGIAPAQRCSHYGLVALRTVALPVLPVIFMRVSSRKGVGLQQPRPKPLTYPAEARICFFEICRRPARGPRRPRRVVSFASEPARRTPRVPWRRRERAETPHRTLSHDLPPFQHAA